MLNQPAARALARLHALASPQEQSWRLSSPDGFPCSYAGGVQLVFLLIGVGDVICGIVALAAFALVAAVSGQYDVA